MTQLKPLQVESKTSLKPQTFGEKNITLVSYPHSMLEIVFEDVHFRFFNFYDVMCKHYCYQTQWEGIARLGVGWWRYYIV